MMRFGMQIVCTIPLDDFYAACYTPDNANQQRGEDMSWQKLGETIQKQGMNLLSGLLVLAAGFILVRYVLKISGRYLKKVRIDPTLESFLNNLIRLILYIIVILTAAGVMGIPLTSVLTLIASAGVAVSLALQGALSNLVGGVMLLVLKPIRVGEYVRIGDADSSIEGTVTGIGAFYTELKMPDHRLISLPNSSLTNTPIINFSREGTRRLDMEFSLSYATDAEKAMSVLENLAKDNPAVFKDPAPVVHISAFGDSGISFLVRIWCKGEDYWDINYYLLEEGKRRLDEAGLEIPFPQMDIHMKQD